MATLASTHLASCDALAQPLPVGGLHVEFWQCAGGAVDDTVAIAPRRGRYVVAAVPGQSASDNVSTLGTSTNVTLTLTASAATSVTFTTMLVVAE